MKKAIVWLALLTATAAQAQPDSTFRWQHRGYINHTEMGMLLGHVSTPASRANFTFTSFNGYRLHRSLAIGLTVGLDWYSTRLVTPISLGLRGDMGAARRVVPFYALDLGYGSMALMPKGLLSSLRGSYTFNPAIGLRLRNRYNNAFTWSVGFKKQEVSSRIELGSGQYIFQQHHYNRLTVRMGMSM